MVIGFAMVATALALIVVANKFKGFTMDDGIMSALIIFTIISCITLIVGVISYPCSVANYAKIEAYDAKKQVYQEVIAKEVQGVIAEGVSALASAAINYLYQREIEETRTFYRMVNRNWFLRWFVAKPPKDLLE